MISFRSATRSIGLLAITFVLAVPYAWGNIVGNPGFENLTAPPWQFSAGPNHPWIYAAGSPNTGSSAVSGGCVGITCMDHTTGDLLFQDLTTSNGATYTLSFWAYDDGTPSELQVLWGGTTVVDLGGPPASASGYGTPGVYALYSVTGLVASSTTTRITFIERQDPGYNGLDDVCVDLVGSTCPTTSTDVPEPASSMLISLGILALAFCSGRRKRA